jgi:hypothetical protein
MAKIIRAVKSALTIRRDGCGSPVHTWNLYHRI